MKLHLPKALLTAVVAVCGLYPAAQAEGIGNSYDKNYTYSGTIYTLDATTAHGSNDSGTLSTNVYVTTRNDAEDPSGWNVATGATVTNSNNLWQSLFTGDSYNTLRISGAAYYGYKFNGLNVGSLIVESGVTGAGIQALVGNDYTNRNITIGYGLITPKDDFFEQNAEDHRFFFTG